MVFGIEYFGSWLGVACDIVNDLRFVYKFFRHENLAVCLGRNMVWIICQATITIVHF